MIKVTVGEQKTQSEKSFPKLMEQKDTRWVMLFLNKTTCIHLTNFNGELVKDYLVDKNTVDYNEPITLQNA